MTWRTSRVSGKKEAPTGDAEAALARIADLLGCDVDAFGEGSDATLDAAETSELLRLWLAIESRENRRRLLDFARSMAGS